MLFNKEVPGELYLANNEIVAYINGKAIVENDWGKLYFVEMPGEYAVIGEVVQSAGLIELTDLPKDEVDFISKTVRGDRDE